MSPALPRRKRPWSVIGAVAATVVHALLLMFGVLGWIAFFESSVLFWVWTAVAVVAAHWMFISSLRLEPGAAKARRGVLAGTATAAGLELVSLGAILHDVLSRACPPEGCVPGNAEWALLYVVLFSPLLFLGGVAVLLLHTRSSAAYFRGRWRRSGSRLPSGRK